MFIQRGTTKVSNHQSSMMKATKYTYTVFIFREPVMQKSDPCNSPRWVLHSPFSVETYQSFLIFNSYNA